MTLVENCRVHREVSIPNEREYSAFSSVCSNFQQKEENLIKRILNGSNRESLPLFTVERKGGNIESEPYVFCYCINCVFNEGI